MTSGNSDLIEAVGKHIERTVGPIATVFDEIDSDALHIDGYRVAPSAEGKG